MTASNRQPCARRIGAAVAAAALYALACRANAEPTGDVLAVSARCTGRGNCFAYYRIDWAAYRIEPGDTLEYDVYVDGSSPEPRGGVDIQCAGGASLRDSGALDDAGRRAHGDADLADAVDRWTHRRIPLASIVGRIASRYDAVCEGDTAGTYVQYLDNIVITNGGAERKVVFRDRMPEGAAIDWQSGYDPLQTYLLLAERRASYARGQIPARPDGVAPFIMVDLSALRERRAIAGPDGRGADFDGAGSALPAGQLPASPTFIAGIPFALPAEGAAADHVQAHGQAVDLRPIAPGAAFVVSFLMTSVSSAFTVPVRIDDESGGSVSLPIAVAPWTDPNEVPGFAFTHRLHDGERVLGPARLQVISAPIALKSKATALRLPETPDLRIFALTVRPVSREQIDDGFREQWISTRFPGPATEEYVRNYRFANLLPELTAEAGRLQRLYDLAVSGSEDEFRTVILERLSSFKEVGRKYKAFTAHVSALLQAPMPDSANVPGSRDALADAIRTIDETEDARAAISGVAMIEAISKADPPILAELKRRLLGKKMEIVSGSWVDLRPSRTGGEAIARNLLYGQRFLAEKLASPCRIACLQLGEELPPTLPQILRKSGIDFILFTAPADTVAASATALPIFGRWEGSDGSRLFWCAPPGGAGASLASASLLCASLESEARHNVPDTLLVPGVGPSLRATLDAVGDVAAARLLPNVKFDRIDTFCDAMSSRSGGAPLPIVQGELAPGRAAGPAPGSRTDARLVAAEARIAAAESLNALLPGAGRGPEIERAWKALLEASASEPKGGGVPAEALARETLEAAAATLAGAVDTRGAGAPSVIVNPLGFPRSEAIEIALPSGDEAYRIVAEDGVELLSQPLKGGRVALVDAPLRAFSHRTLRAVPSGPGAGETPPPIAEVRASEWALENRFVRVELDAASGRIVSLLDKAAGRELISGRPGSASGVLVSAADGKGERPLAVASREILEAGPIRATFRMTMDAGSGAMIRQDVSLEASSPCVTVLLEATPADLLTISVALPVAGLGPFGTTVEAPFGASERKAPFPGSGWIDVASVAPGGGLALAYDARGALAVDASGTVSASFGDSARFRLVPHGTGSWREADVVRQAAALRVPLLVRPESAHDGSIPPSRGPLVESDGSSGAVIEGIKRAEDGRGLIVRLRESRGLAADVSLRFASAVEEATEADLLERPSGHAFRARDAEVPVGLTPFEVQTLRVVLK